MEIKLKAHAVLRLHDFGFFVCAMVPGHHDTHSSTSLLTSHIQDTQVIPLVVKGCFFALVEMET